jgi:Molybdopterin-binding domain of aldehyde dehydrogenase
VEGQVVGGLAHGIGNALFERLHHDAGAQPQSTSFAEYLLPTAPDMPPIAIVHSETASSLNPLGVQGAGEGGTIAAIAAIIAAVEHALAPIGVKINEAPISPAWIVAPMNKKRGAHQARYPPQEQSAVAARLPRFFAVGLNRAGLRGRCCIASSWRLDERSAVCQPEDQSC